MSTKLVNPAGLYDGAPVGMSQAKVDLESGFVFVSGQVDWDGDSRVRHATLDGQAEGAIEHLVTVLNEAGSSLDNVLAAAGVCPRRTGGRHVAARAGARPPLWCGSSCLDGHRRGFPGIA